MCQKWRRWFTLRVVSRSLEDGTSCGLSFAVQFCVVLQPLRCIRCVRSSFHLTTATLFSLLRIFLVRLGVSHRRDTLFQVSRRGMRLILEGQTIWLFLTRCARFAPLHEGHVFFFFSNGDWLRFPPWRKAVSRAFPLAHASPTKRPHR